MNEKMKWIVFVIVVIIVLIFVNKVFATGKKVTQEVGDDLHKLGIGGSEKAKALKGVQALKPSFYRSLKGDVHLITQAVANDFAKKIYDARTMVVYTNDAVILGVFKQLSYQSQVSFLADTFQKKYGEDLLNYFYSPMEDSYLVQLYDLINSLPKQ